MRRGTTKILLVIALLVLVLGCATQMATRPTPMAEKALGQQTVQSSTPVDTKPTLMGVLVNHTGKQSRVVILGNKRLTYTTFELDNPPCINIDLGAEAAPRVLGQTKINNGTLKAVEVLSIDGKKNLHRVKINLGRTTNYKIIREQYNLAVVIDNLSQAEQAGIQSTSDRTAYDTGSKSFERVSAAQAGGGVNRILAFGFKPLGEQEGSRLSIRLTGPVTPSVISRDQGRTVILSLSPVRVADTLLRPLDTSYFKSAVDLINPVRVGANVVNLNIRLRQAVPYHLNQTNGYIHVDFDPSQVAPKKIILPSPDVAKRPAAVQPRAVAAARGEIETRTVSKGALVSPEGRVYSGKLVSLDFQNADIHNILRLIGEVSGKNVVISDRVKGKVTLTLKDVPWDQALDIILASQNLGLEIVGNVLRIEEASRLLEEKKRRQIELELEEKEREVLITRIWTPKYAGVEKMRTLLEPLKSADGTIKAIGNDIFVKEREDVLQLMEEVFRKNDKATMQILIEARIVEASTSFAKNLGINWGGTLNDPRGRLGGLLLGGSLGGSLTANGLFGATNSAVNLIAAPATGLGLGLSFATAAVDINANLYAMEQSGEGRIVSAPRILANNDEEVFIKQGQSIPFETTATVNEPSKIDFKEAELKLEVTPHIEENGKIISMKITVTKDTPDFARSARNPPINTRQASTKLMVRDGETVVIGGIIIDDRSRVSNRVPWIHNVPILGWLFKSQEVMDSTVELLIFITAHIIPVKI
ncbi:MAG: type IV pilus secretin PilQ [Deltaproteobacteria bacterium]|nr:type IV pilus secretin PilQ [Deltaproteobacteria bacterium]